MTADVDPAQNWIHRRDGGPDDFFLVNLSCQDLATAVRFRVAGKQPELWDPVTGDIRDLAEFTATRNGTTEVPLQFAPQQSFFVVFRRGMHNTASGSRNGRKNFPATRPALELAGAWDVAFDAKWLYPEAGKPRQDVRHPVRIPGPASRPRGKTRGYV